jgi:hypothetical protein
VTDELASRVRPRLPDPRARGARRRVGEAKPPPPPPDSPGDCTFVFEVDVPDYLVLASIVVGVRCETTKQRIDVTAELTRDGVTVPLIPLDPARSPAH